MKVSPDSALPPIGHKERLTVTSIIGDLRTVSDLEQAFKGADVVIHNASLIETGLFPNYKRLEAVNVKGTPEVLLFHLKGFLPRKTDEI